MNKNVSLLIVSVGMLVSPRFVFAFDNGFLSGFDWMAALLLFFVFGIILGLVGMIYGLIIRIIRYFSKDKNKKIFRNNKKIVAYSLAIFILSLVSYMFVMINWFSIGASSSSF